MANIDDTETRSRTKDVDRHNFYIAAIFFAIVGICAVLGLLIALVYVLLNFGQTAILHDVIKIGSALLSGIVAGGALIYARTSVLPPR